MAFEHQVVVRCSSAGMHNFCICIAEGRRRGLPVMAKMPCFRPGSHTSCPNFLTMTNLTICSHRGEGVGGGEGAEGGAGVHY